MKTLILLFLQSPALLYVGLLILAIVAYHYCDAYCKEIDAHNKSRHNAIDLHLKVTELTFQNRSNIEHSQRLSEQKLRLENHLVAIYGLAKNSGHLDIADIAFQSLPENVQKLLL